MPHFVYTVVSRVSGVKRGVLEAENLEQASLSLEEQGFQVILLERGIRQTAKQEWRRLRWFFAHPLTRREHILFIKRFRTLFVAGVPMPRLLRILREQSEQRELFEALSDIGQRVAAGSTLHQAFAAHPVLFSSLDVALIHAGEYSGSLGEALNRLILMCEHEDHTRRTIATALRYPKIVACALCVSFFILLHWIVPSFVVLFHNARHELPLPTRIAIRLNEIISSGWPILLALGIGTTILALWLFRLPRYTGLKDTLVLRLPCIGDAVRKSLLARFAFLFSMLQQSGVGILESMDILAGTINNTVLAHECSRIRIAVQAGQGLAQAFSGSSFFPSLAVNMIAVGEDAGKMESVLKDLALHYDEEVASSVSVLTEAVGPILTLLLAGMTGFFALAVLLPMWDMVGLPH